MNKTGVSQQGALVAAIVLLAGCGSPLLPLQSPPPQAAEIEAHVRSQVPLALQLRQFRVVSITAAGKSWQVQFETVLAPRETLYQLVDLDAELARLQWKKNANAPGAAEPVLIRPVQEPTDSFPAIGQLTARKAGAWQFDNFRWDVDERMRGQPRHQFAAGALLLGSTEANEPVLRYIQQGKFAALPVRSGPAYKEIALQSFESDSFMISHAQGIGQVRFEDMPPALQALFYYDRARVQRLRAQHEAAVAQARRARQAEAEATAARSRSTPSDSSSSSSQPERPPSNVEDLIAERLRAYTASPSTILVKTKAPVFDEMVWAWKVEFEYSFYLTDGRTPGGRRIEGTSYAWFRDKLLVRWRDIVPPRSPYSANPLPRRASAA